MHPERGTIRWHRPPTMAIREPAEPFAEQQPQGFDLLELLHRVGIPIVEDAKTAQEAALALLGVAAEVEQALMVQYLYAAVSVSADPGPDGVDHRQSLLGIAVQEMGHLATVQNLLLLLGGRDAFHLQRDVLRLRSDENPIPFVLEPLSASSIATYVVAEMPAKVPPELAGRVAELVELAEQVDGDDIHRVGVIYELLKWMFGSESSGFDFAALAPLPDPPTLTDGDLQDLATVARYEARREEWQIFEEEIILPAITTRKQARDAVTAIAAQGEGLQGVELSHFEAFLQMDRAFRDGAIVVRPMATAPTLDAAACPPSTAITHPYTRLWAQVFNAHYQLLVVTLYQAFGTARTDDEEGGRRQKLAKLAVSTMRTVIFAVADIVAELPLLADGSGVAGPPFALDAALLESNDDMQLTARQLHLLDQLSCWYGAIEGDAAFPAHPEHTAALINLRKFDMTRRNTISPPPTPGG